MRKILILVEGPTEERFVKTVLQSIFLAHEIFLQPVIVATKRVFSGGKFKGGVPSYPKVRAEVLRLLRDSSAIAVTTMLDYYALPSSFPGRAQPVGNSAMERVSHVETAWRADIDDQRFSPYLSLHEFEALLFSDPDKIAQGFAKPELAVALHAIRNNFRTPEEIDDNPDTAPSARLEKLYPRYSKPFFGSLIAGRIGIDSMCNACEHFADWVNRLRAL